MGGQFSESKQEYYARQNNIILVKDLYKLRINVHLWN